MDNNEGPIIELTKVIEEWIDKLSGITKKIVEKKLTDEPVDLGSIKKPLNSNVVSIKITVPSNLFNTTS